jgi:hypothetical protein
MYQPIPQQKANFKNYLGWLGLAHNLIDES